MMNSRQRGFYFLNATQFLGAANDNILKQVLIYGLAVGGVWADQLGPGGQAWASLCLAIPFVLLSGFAGQYSDKYSKQRVSILSKWSEILIALIAMFGLWLTNLWLVLFALVIIAVQSTFFSPSKFGILPEIIPKEKLSRANGTINMFTYIAIILGCAVGGPLYSAYAPDKLANPDVTPLLWLPGAVILLVGVLGAAASHGIPTVPAQNPKLKIRYRLFEGYIQTWQQLRGTTLKTVIVGWSFFYMIIAGIAVLILPDYKNLLDITYFQTSLLMALLGISTGVGDYVAGRISGHHIRPELLPIGTAVTAAAFLALGLIPANVVWVAILLAVGGFTCGFVMVPLQTMVQHLSSVEERGQVLGLWNCGSFVGIIIGNLLFLGIRHLGIPSNRVFILCALLTAFLQILYHTRWRKRFAESVKQLEV
ncbi:MAG: MFS transporter [Mariniblastus sp.]|nr:MFS transporter [Mariniblastus sp.]